MPPNLIELAELAETIKNSLPRANPHSLKHTVMELWELVQLADKEFGGIKGLVEAVKASRNPPTKSI